MRVAKKDWLVINYILLSRYVFLWLRQKLCLLYLLPRSPPWKLRVAHRNEILGRRCRRPPMQPERANIFPLLWSPPPSCHLPLPDSMSHHRHRCQVRTFLSTSRRTNRTVDIILLSCSVGPPSPGHGRVVPGVPPHHSCYAARWMLCNILSSCLFSAAWKVLMKISKRGTDPELHGLMKRGGKLIQLSGTWSFHTVKLMIVISQNRVKWCYIVTLKQIFILLSVVQ
jgi:hypothetical protein